MRHGEIGAEDMSAYLLLERAFCECEALCTCGWDEEGDEA